MNRKPLEPDDSWEIDSVWKLLDHVTPVCPSPRFVDDTVRAARLADQTSPWWKRLFTPAPLAGLAATAAAVVFTVISLHGPGNPPASHTAMIDTSQTAEIQDIAEAQTLIAAVAQLDDFSDSELVSLIGF